MKRFLVFSFADREAEGGMNDKIGDADTLDNVHKLIADHKAEYVITSYCNYQYLDLTTGDWKNV